MKAKAATLVVVVAFASILFAAEGPVPKGVPHLDHVWVIMMENHGLNQIVNNPNAPFANQLVKSANFSANYFAIGHPSSTNYLEVVGGSNFGVRSDNNPDWHNATCSPNLALGTVVTDNPSSPNVCPIAGSGTDAETPLIDLNNECSPAPCNPGLIDINGSMILRATPNTVGKSIADQLAERGMTWKS